MRTVQMASIELVWKISQKGQKIPKLAAGNSQEEAQVRKIAGLLAMPKSLGKTLNLYVIIFLCIIHANSQLYE